jgi:hypothetical protein
MGKKVNWWETVFFERKACILTLVSMEARDILICRIG